MRIRKELEDDLDFNGNSIRDYEEDVITNQYLYVIAETLLDIRDLLNK